MDERARLEDALGDQSFDESAGLVTEPLSESPDYHTALTGDQTVHPTRESLRYALGLLDAGIHTERAIDIVETVVALQDDDQDSETYGIWPWFGEEPLEEMATPDNNWAQFCGKPLVMTLRRHADALPADLVAAIEDSVRHATRATIQRDVETDYTNIAVMSAELAVLAGETLEEPEYVDFGVEKFEAIRARVEELGAFGEYNSPTYTTVVLLDLSRTQTEAETAAALDPVADLLDRAWTTVAEHHHVPSGEWAGPHARNYGPTMDARTRSFLELGLPAGIGLVSAAQREYHPDWFGIDVQCPEGLIEHFERSQERRVERRIPGPGEERVTARTVLNDRYALGSFDHGIAWSQRNNLLANVPTDDGPVTVDLRVLKDGTDYSSAVVTSAHHAGTVLFGVSLIDDGGDTHPNLDPTDGVLECEDLRVRVRVGGATDGLAWNGGEDAGADEARVALGECPLSVGHLWSTFPAAETTTDVSETADGLVFDGILYDGPPLSRSMDEIRVGGVFALSLEDPPVTGGAGNVETTDETVEAELDLDAPGRATDRGDASLGVRTSLVPAT